MEQKWPRTQTIFHNSSTKPIVQQRQNSTNRHRMTGKSPKLQKSEQHNVKLLKVRKLTSYALQV